MRLTTERQSELEQKLLCKVAVLDNFVMFFTIAAQICERICCQIVNRSICLFKGSKRNDMVNTESSSICLSCFPATWKLTNFITFPSLASLSAPIRAIARLITTLPGWTICSYNMSALPFSQAGFRTKLRRGISIFINKEFFSTLNTDLSDWSTLPRRIQRTRKVFSVIPVLFSFHRFRLALISALYRTISIALKTATRNLKRSTTNGTDLLYSCPIWMILTTVMLAVPYSHTVFRAKGSSGLFIWPDIKDLAALWTDLLYSGWRRCARACHLGILKVSHCNRFFNPQGNCSPTLNADRNANPFFDLPQALSLFLTDTKHDLYHLLSPVYIIPRVPSIVKHAMGVI